jgi:hypothetical protein
LKRGLIADRYRLDAPISAISHPAGQPQSTCFAAHCVPKPYALHLTSNAEMQCPHLQTIPRDFSAFSCPSSTPAKSRNTLAVCSPSVGGGSS